MTRCHHGFQPGAVACPSGCHGGKPPRKWQRKPEVSTADMLRAIEREGSIKGAARALGVHKGTFYDRAKVDAELAQVMERISKASPKLIDMTGKTIDGWLVLRRAENTGSSAAWVCRHTCGHDRVLVGTQLRSGKVSCRKCRGGR